MSKKIAALGVVIGACVLGLVITKQRSSSAPTGLYTIGILQTASHPALDAVREGFIEELKSKLGTDVAFVIQNAQGSVSQAHALAQQFYANKKVAGIFAIATPAAQAMSAVEKTKPIFIAAVTDPAVLGLTSLTNICGVTDAINVSGEIDMLTQLLPSASDFAKASTDSALTDCGPRSLNVGLLYTSGEINSQVMAKQMKQELESRGLIVSDFAVTNESDLAAVTEVACRKVDVLLAPTDNTVASAVSLISGIALKNKKPFIVSDNMLVKFGPLAARGVDYGLSGKQAADIAYKVVVEGKKPYELPIEQADSSKAFVNRETMGVLGLTVPEALQNDVVLV
jgi:putative ABC transport system substrate-binding protein